MNDQLLRSLLRGVAIVVALAAAIDPSITSERSSKPEVSVVALDARADSVAAKRVADRLSRSFTVLREPYAASVATVLVGTNPVSMASGGAVFAVVPDNDVQDARIERVDVPDVAAVDARVAVSAALQLRGLRGKPIELTLRSNGAVVDRVSQQVEQDSARLSVPLSFVPTAPGVASLRVELNAAGSADTSSADAAISVRNQKWAVLFFDPRPSWMSTFVRRAVERDTRFAVTSRIVTATNISTDAGRPPVSLDDPSVVDLFDAIVVGAPDLLGERDTQGLQNFLRRRGGSVVLLFDENKAGRYQRLADFPAFTNIANSQAAIISEPSGDSLAMRSTEWMWPTRLPEGAQVMAWSDYRNPNAAQRRPIVWMMQAGAGRVVVSGALDAWKFRDSRQSGFDKFWQQTIASAAAAATPSVSIEVQPSIAEPGAEVQLRVTSRAAALAEFRADRPVRSELTVSIGTDSTRAPVSMWPTGSPGEFRGSVRAPRVPGNFNITALADGSTASAPLVVARDVRVANVDDRALLGSITAGNGGRVISERDIGSLPGLVESAIQPSLRRVSWHPMRSAWWLVPFVGALSLEWLLRRRRGMP